MGLPRACVRSIERDEFPVTSAHKPMIVVARVSVLSR
jgi:hypothetical protein